jgi:hypothetical protein
VATLKVLRISAAAGSAVEVGPAATGPAVAVGVAVTMGLAELGCGEVTTRWATGAAVTGAAAMGSSSPVYGVRSGL